MRNDEARELSKYFGVHDGPTISIGFSATAILIMLILFLVFISLPVVFSLRKAPADMVAGGSNSLVLSAACHANTYTRSRGKTLRQQSQKENSPNGPRVS